MTDSPTVYTIGFTKTSAKSFFDRLAKANTKRVIDVRLHNTSQLAGFAKAEDLAFFLKELGNIDYHHETLFAPEEGMLSEYKRGGGSWIAYEAKFMDLMSRRKIEQKIDPDELNRSCLLCSESTPHYCHRRLVCEYLNSKWTRKFAVKHL
jgi:uncharacterized protein (DUF488 family)